METFELPGPERVPCAVCEGVPWKPPADGETALPKCIKCGGTGATPQMHAYVVTRHKPTEGMHLSLVCQVVMVDSVGTDGSDAERLARVEKLSQHQLLYGVLREFKPAEIRDLFSHTTRDGKPVDPDVVYVDNYGEMTNAIVQVAKINSFFGRRAST